MLIQVIFLSLTTLTATLATATTTTTNKMVATDDDDDGLSNSYDNLCCFVISL